MGQEISLIHGHVSLNLLYWKKNLQTDFCGPGGVDEKQLTSRPELWEQMGKSQSEGEAKVVT